MKVTFDPNIRIAGIGLVPWARLGPERWFPDYRIAALYDWDLPASPNTPPVLSLGDPASAPQLGRYDSQHLIATTEFQSLLRCELSGYKLFTYRPISVPEQVHATGATFLNTDPTITKLVENKVDFRERFADLGLPFPKYATYDRSQLTLNAATLHKLLHGRQSVILQDEALSGGRGTFVVSTLKDLEYACEALEKQRGGQQVVVSEHITPARERSVQACATRYGVFVGPLQKQIIGDPLLANLEVPEGDRFCGAEISPHDPLLAVYPEIKAYTERIGQRLIELGYRGIFSVDCLVDASGKVYVLEVNPRLTGITPLITALYREGQDIPFYLLHILEIAQMEYEITDYTLDKTPPAGSLLIVHAHNNRQATLEKALVSGVYNASLRQVSQSHKLGTAKDDFLIQRHNPPGFRLRPGNRTFSVFSRGPVLDEQDRLLPSSRKVVNYLQSHTKYKESQT